MSPFSSPLAVDHTRGILSAEGKAGGGAKAAKAAVARARGQMMRDDAMAILNVEAAPGSTLPDIADVEAHYKKYYECNDPNNGGSFYLQSKVFRAKECLDEEFTAEAEGRASPSAEDGASEEEEKKAGSSVQ